MLAYIKKNIESYTNIHTRARRYCIFTAWEITNVSLTPIYSLITEKLSCLPWQIPRLFQPRKERGKRGLVRRKRVTRRGREGEMSTSLRSSHTLLYSRKKTIYRTFNFQSPSAGSIHRVSESTGMARIPSFRTQPLSPLSVPLQTYDCEARRKAPSCAIFPMIPPLTLQRIELQG